MQLSTPVALPTAPFQLDPDRHVLTLGSCFAQHIGQHIADALPAGHALVNPFGPLYAPRVIAHHLGVLLDTQPLPDHTFFEGREGLWHNRWFSTHVSAGDAATCRTHTAAALARARESLRRADVLVLTLGTDRHYRLHDGRLVANCHKQPAADFTEHPDTVDDLTVLLLEAVGRLRALRPDLHIVWTVSPYRYAKYGLHASQLSKARLLLAVDAVCALFISRPTKSCSTNCATTASMRAICSTLPTPPSTSSPNALPTGVSRPRCVVFLPSALA